MNAAETMIARARAHGIDMMFANPGTTEMPVVNALAHHPEIRGVLGLHENVCSAAADGYGRITGKPALTLLHLGPGFGNGLANFHNAKKARTPMINIIGDHAAWHLDADAPLTMDVASLAGTVSHQVTRIDRRDHVTGLFDDAITAALGHGGQIATLIFPHDIQFEETAPTPMVRIEPAPVEPVLPKRVEDAAAELTMPGKKAILIGGKALYGPALEAAAKIAAITGASLISETAFAKMACGRGLPSVQRLPYFPEQAQALLDMFDHVVVCGTRLPVSFFGYANLPSRFLEGRSGVVQLCDAGGDIDGALGTLLERLPHEPTSSSHLANRANRANRAMPDHPQAGPLTVESMAALLVRAQPADAIVVPTAVSSSFAYCNMSDCAPPHTQLVLTGGAIGAGAGLAAGAALAAPGHKVINLEADGSAAYLPQAFWTQARENLNILTVICANNRYNILQMELQRAGINEIAGAAHDLTDLGRPRLDWVNIANGFGVEASRCQTVEELAVALDHAMARTGPYLIEAVLP